MRLDIGVGVWIWYQVWVEIYSCGEGVKILGRDMLVDNFERAADVDVFQAKFSALILAPIWVLF